MGAATRMAAIDPNCGSGTDGVIGWCDTNGGDRTGQQSDSGDGTNGGDQTPHATPLFWTV